MNKYEFRIRERGIGYRIKVIEASTLLEAEDKAYAELSSGEDLVSVTKTY